MGPAQPHAGGEGDRRAQHPRVPRRADLHEARVPAPADLPGAPPRGPRQRPAQGLHRDRLRRPAGCRAPAARRATRSRVGQPEHPRQRRHDRADRRPGLADRYQLPPYAHELNPAGLVWSHLKRSLANLAKRNIAQLTALVKTRLKQMQYRPALLGGFLASTRLDLTPFCTPTLKDR